MPTHYVLIDFENVQPSGLARLRQDHFKVLVFVGANQGKVSFETAAALQEMGAHAEYVKISGSGRNALDFHIAFYAGQLAERDPKALFHIISKDGGFDPLIKHLQAKGTMAARVASIDDIPRLKAEQTGSSVRASEPAKPAVDRAALYMSKLSNPKASRPRTLKTLTSSVGAHFQKQLTEAEVSGVIAVMEQEGFIEIKNGKVSYRPNE